MTLSRLTQALADRYRIERELGAGGMATVYLAHDLKHDRDVAIKVLHPDLGAALGADRFLTEIKTTARLQHPHILPLLDSGEADGLLFYVMPLVRGETLRDRLQREQQLPVADALRIAREVADALAEAHAVGIVHRDIKPENILLQGAHALVADFGISLAVQQAGGARMTQTGLSLGTPQYMAPEQAMGDKTIDHRVDIYALGAVTYEMLTGEPPHTGPNPQAIVAKLLSEPVRPSTVLRPATPPHVEAALQIALQRLAADRFATVQEFSEALRGGTGARTIAAVSTASGAHATAAGRRRGQVVAAITLVAFAAVGGWWIGRQGGTAAATSASLSIPLPDSLPLEPTRGSWEYPAGQGALALSPNGQRLVFVSRHGATTALYQRRLDNFATELIPGTDSALSPFFSPTGDAVGFFAGAKLKTVALADGRVNVVADAIQASGGVWLDDGRIVYVVKYATYLGVVPAAGGRATEVACSLCGFPSALPGGRWILTSAATGLYRVEIATGKFVPVLRRGGRSVDDQVPGVYPRYDGDGHVLWVQLDGRVYAASIDVEKSVLTSEPVVLAEGVRVEGSRGVAQFAVASSGAFVFAPGPNFKLGSLIRVDRTGRVDSIPTPPAPWNQFHLSPDGNRIVAVVEDADGQGELRIIDARTGTTTPWLRGRWFLSGRRVMWKADGKHVVFGRDGRFFEADPDLTTEPVPVLPGRGWSSMNWTTDLTTVAAAQGDTVVIFADGGKAERMRLVVPGGDIPALTGDGRWLVDAHNKGARTIMIASALDGSKRQFVIDGQGKLNQQESSSGGDEFYFTEDFSIVDSLPSTTVYAVKYTAGATNPFGPVQPLFRVHASDFPGRSYSIGMQGQRFIFRRSIADRPTRELRVLTDWHQRLRATSGAAKP
jgi:hypothetical protein